MKLDDLDALDWILIVVLFGLLVIAISGRIAIRPMPVPALVLSYPAQKAEAARREIARLQSGGDRSLLSSSKRTAELS